VAVTSEPSAVSRVMKMPPSSATPHAIHSRFPTSCPRALATAGVNTAVNLRKACDLHVNYGGLPNTPGLAVCVESLDHRGNVPLVSSKGLG